MFPIGDDNSARHITPVVNFGLIALNVLVFVLLQGLGGNLEFTYAWSAVPEEIITGTDIVTAGEVLRDPSTGEQVQVPGLQPTPISVYLTLLSSMFMHGGLAHLGGNMLYLWVFGDNIENALGHGRYLAFYLVCGLAASLAHVMTSVLLASNLLIPSLGASGAISGVLGGYLLLFPKNPVNVIIFYQIRPMPAIIVLGLWFLMQLLGGFGTVGAEGGGVAYGAHIGGFIAGLVLVKLFMAGREIPQVPPPHIGFQGRRPMQGPF
jgi:membrane associated rhomboid family serine protease